MDRLQALKKYIKKNKERALKHLNKTFDIAKLSDEEIFYMLCFCILVPAGKATRTDTAIELLKSIDYYRKPISDAKLFKLIKPYIRFPKQKTERLIKLKEKQLLIIESIKVWPFEDFPDSFVRDYLVKSVQGLGYKAASHFLRNLGAKNIAVLDVHVLKYAYYFLPLASELRPPEVPTTKKRYEYIENHFCTWAYQEFGLKATELDWILWCFESGNDVEAFKY